MQKREISLEKIKDIIADVAMISPDFSDKSHLKDDLGLDSMTIIGIILELNQNFNVEIKSSDIKEENFSCVDNIRNFLESII